MLQAAGGRDLVVRRIAQAHPWLRDFQVGTLAETIDDDTEHDLSPTVSVADGTYHYVSDLLVGDVRTECVAIATQLFAVIPDLEMARLICLDARGEPYGLPGFEMANLWLRKRYFPSTDEVAWNRARLRIIEALLVTGTHTDRVRRRTTTPERPRNVRRRPGYALGPQRYHTREARKAQQRG